MALWLGLAPCLDYFVFKFGLAVCLESFAFNFGFALSLVHVATCSGVAIVLIRLRPERFAQQPVGGRDPLAEMSKSGSRSLHPFQCGWSRRQIEGVQENCPEVVAVGKRFGEVQFSQVGCKVWVRQNYAPLSSSRRNSLMLWLWNRQAWPIRK